MKYSILVITDHFSHGKGESIYPLLFEMQKNEKCKKIDVVSRGNSGNQDFFLKHKSQDFFVKTVDESFVYDDQGKGFVCNTILSKLENYDFIILRIDRPVTSEFLKFLISEFPKEKIINSPDGMILTGSKEFLLNFPNLCPPMKICKSIEDIEYFKKKHSMVLKPLENYGGFGLIKIENNEVIEDEVKYDYNDYRTILKKKIKGKYLAMKFLKNVTKGDKRVIVINGKIMGAILRLPPLGSYICNLSKGGSSSYAEVTEDEILIANKISPLMIENGVAIFGFDTLVDDTGKRVLSEINTLNVGGLLQAEKHSGLPVIKNSSDEIWNFIEQLNKKADNTVYKT